MAINTPFMVTEVDPQGRAVGAAKYATTVDNAKAVARDILREARTGHTVYAFKIFAHVEIDVNYRVVADEDPMGAG